MWSVNLTETGHRDRDYFVFTKPSECAVRRNHDTNWQGPSQMMCLKYLFLKGVKQQKAHQILFSYWHNLSKCLPPLSYSSHVYTYIQLSYLCNQWMSDDINCQWGSKCRTHWGSHTLEKTADTWCIMPQSIIKQCCLLFWRSPNYMDGGPLGESLTLKLLRAM